MRGPRSLVLAVAPLVLVALASARGDDAATVQYDAAEDYSVSLPPTDVPEGGRAELVELLEPAVPRAKGFANGLTLAVRRIETTADAYSNKLLIELARAGQRVLAQEKKTVDGSDALLVDSLGKVKGEECRQLSLFVFAPRFVISAQLAVAPAVFSAHEAALRASIASFKLGSPPASGSYFASATYGFSIVPPAWTKPKAVDGLRLLAATAPDDKSGVTVALRAKIAGSKEAVRDELAKAYAAKGAKVAKSSFTTVSGTDAVLVELATKEEKRFALHVLRPDSLLVVTGWAASAQAELREPELRAAVGSVRLGPSGEKPRIDADPKAAPAVAAVKPPELAKPYVARCQFTAKGAKHLAGTAFAVKSSDGDKVLVITALHIFGLESVELAKALPEVDLLDVDSEEPVGKTEKSFIIGDSYVLRQTEKGFEAAGDIALFLAPRALKLKPFTLASQPAKDDEKVWLAARLDDPNPARLFEGYSMRTTDQAVEIRIPGLKDRAPLNGTSGAPWVNAKGEVVALNLGSYDNEKLGVVAIAQPVGQITRHIRDVVGK